jgi:putative DNA primase/helicase
MSDNGNTSRWPKATRERPCPLCRHTNRCLIAPDGGAVVCWRQGDGSVTQLNRKPSNNGNGNGIARNCNGTTSRPVTRRSAARSFATREAAIEATLASVRREHTHAEVTQVYEYHVAGGAILFCVTRFDWPGDKTFRPVHLHKNAWHEGDPAGLLPLYGLHELPAGCLVYVCEGEKATEAAKALGLVATTSAHGSSSAEKTDWSPLAGRDVVILPDNDEAGEKYARTVAKACSLLDPPARVKTLRLPRLPEGGDIVEFVAAAGTKSEIGGLANDLPVIEPSSIIGGPVLIDMADIKRVPITWLWPNRIPAGRVTLLAGIPGCGKSFFTTDLSARITTGAPWPDRSGNAPLGSVLMIVAEDNPADTIGPRLDAAGADTSHGKVKLLTMIRRTDSETGKQLEQCFTLADVRELETAIRSMPEIKLVIIDPIGSYLGARVDSHRDNEVRSALQPVVALAEKYNVAVLIIAHVRKALTSMADDGVLGSRAFTGLARQVWHLTRDKADRERRLLLPGKTNVTAQPDGLAFTIAGEPVRIVWELDPVKLHADDVLSDNQQPGPEPEARRAAEEWLVQILASGRVPSGDLTSPRPGTIRGMAKEADMKWATIRRAADHLGVRRERDPWLKVWVWRLPKKVVAHVANHVVQPEQQAQSEQHEQHQPDHRKTNGAIDPQNNLLNQDSAFARACTGEVDLEHDATEDVFELLEAPNGDLIPLARQRGEL